MTPRVLAAALIAGLFAGPVLGQGWTVRPLPRPEPAAVRVPLEEIRPVPRPDGIAGQAEEVRAKCLAPETVDDEDLRRHAATFLANPRLCVETESFVEHNLDWQFTIITNTRKRRGPVLILLHDNEDASFETALYGIVKYGGKVVAVEASGRRIFKAVQDPNRNFAASARAAATCQEMKIKSSPVFTEMVRSHFHRRHPVITLHNNDDGYSGGGGAGTISAARQSAVLTGLMTPKPAGRLSDEDNAVLLASTRSLGENADAGKDIAFFHARGINVIYEHVRPDINDCSLSNYVVLNRLGDYYNLEAEHGDAASQKVMFDALMERLKIK